MGKTVVTSISIDSDFLKLLDKFAEKMGYTSRSEVVRDSLRRLIEEQKVFSSGENVLAAIITIYNRNVRNVASKLSAIRHSFDDVIIGSLHVHIMKGYCSEFILARGSSERISELVVAVRRIKGLDSFSYALAALE